LTFGQTAGGAGVNVLGGIKAVAVDFESDNGSNVTVGGMLKVGVSNMAEVAVGDGGVNVEVIEETFTTGVEVLKTLFSALVQATRLKVEHKINKPNNMFLQLIVFYLSLEDKGAGQRLVLPASAGFGG
jgi:hypothetical protein